MMTPGQFLFSALLLGLFVALAGAYGLLYSVGRLKARQRIASNASLVAYALLCAVAILIVVATTLDAGWKALIVTSGALYFWIPPKTFDYLESLHSTEDRHP